jgi:secreted PhoX family phosphatase
VAGGLGRRRQPDPATDSVRSEARSHGAAVFVRGEGLWLHDGAVYFTATSGGPVDGARSSASIPPATAVRSP